LESHDASDGGVVYDVTVDRRCWRARLVLSGGMLELPARPTGCIDLFDRLRILGGSSFVRQGLLRTGDPRSSLSP
jgi:hypothetical protein